jgi:hypothetical protein
VDRARIMGVEWGTWEILIQGQVFSRVPRWHRGGVR